MAININYEIRKLFQDHPEVRRVSWSQTSEAGRVFVTSPNFFKSEDYGVDDDDRVGHSEWPDTHSGIKRFREVLDTYNGSHVHMLGPLEQVVVVTREKVTSHEYIVEIDEEELIC